MINVASSCPDGDIELLRVQILRSLRFHKRHDPREHYALCDYLKNKTRKSFMSLVESYECIVHTHF